MSKFGMSGWPTMRVLLLEAFQELVERCQTFSPKDIKATFIRAAKFL